MLLRFRSLIASSIVLLAPTAAGAVPITYDFTGTLDKPIQGVGQFSGSFTVDSNPSFLPLPRAVPTGGSVDAAPSGELSEQSDNASMTLHLGAQTFQFANVSSQGNAALDVLLYPPGMAPGLPATEDISVSGALSSGPSGPSPSLMIDFHRAATGFSTADLSDLASPSFQTTVSLFVMSDNQNLGGHATLTSIEEVPAPEPGSLAIFGGLAVAAYLTGRRRAGGRSGADARRAGPRAPRG